MRISRLGWLALVSAVTLAACGGAASGPTPAARTGGTSAGSGPESTEVPASPSSAPAPTPTAGTNRVLVELTRSGGLKGDTVTLVVYEDSSAELYDGTRREGKLRSSITVEPGRMAALRKALQGDWQSGKGSLRQNPDAFTYEIRTQGGKATTSDGEKRGPGLEALLKALTPIMKDAEAGR